MRKKSLMAITAAMATAVIISSPISIKADVLDRGFADSYMEVMLEDARLSGDDSDLYDTAKTGGFSVEVLENVLERGFLKVHVDEFKLLGYLPQTYDIKNKNISGGHGSTLEAGTEADTSMPNVSDGNALNNGKAAAPENESADPSSSADAKSDGLTDDTKIGASDPESDKGNTSGKKNSNPAAASTSSGSNNSSISSGKGSNNDNAEEKNERIRIDESTIPTEEIEGVYIEGLPSDTTYGRAIITKKDKSQIKVFFDGKWLKKIDSKIITYSEEALEENKVEPKSLLKEVSVYAHYIIILIILVAILIFVKLYKKWQQDRDINKYKTNI